MSNLGTRSKMIHVLANQTAATTTQNSAAVDMQGWDSVVFIGQYATVHATTVGVNIAQSTASGGTYVDCAGTTRRGVTDWRIEVNKPLKRYLRAEIHRVSGVLGSTWAIQYNGRALGTPTDSYVLVNSPT